MKKKIFYLLILIAGLVLGGSSVNRVYSQAQKSYTTKQQTVKYTCPMHPEVIKDKPGKCPICGMTLVVKKGSSKTTMHHNDSFSMMKENHMKMMNNSSKMKQGHMMNNSSKMKQGHMMKDSTSMKGGKMGM